MNPRLVVDPPIPASTEPAGSPDPADSHDHSSHHHTGPLLPAALAALGVVYGDIGTSPLYALRECFVGESALAVTPANVLGILSLVFWSLTMVVSIKYLTFLMRADNEGEGGILALLALVGPRSNGTLRRNGLLLIGLFGAALLYGDGVITPAISVLSAVEGLRVATDSFEPFILPISVILLVGLFVVQRRGTAGVVAVFGPAMLVWFVTIGALGLTATPTQQPTHASVLSALNPLYGVEFFAAHGTKAFLALGAVVLCVTGSEALYADMGHFGARPIRFAWYAVAFPALLLNYFGQGAFLLSAGGGVANPFYQLAPSWALYPLVALSTVATIIASQALISGRLLAVAAGSVARLRAAADDRAHLGHGGRADLHAGDQLGVDGHVRLSRPRFQELEQPRWCVWDRRHRHDDGDQRAVLRPHARALALVAGARRRRDRGLPRLRPLLSSAPIFPRSSRADGSRWSSASPSSPC